MSFFILRQNMLRNMKTGKHTLVTAALVGARRKPEPMSPKTRSAQKRDLLLTFMAQSVAPKPAPRRKSSLLKHLLSVFF